MAHNLEQLGFESVGRSLKRMKDYPDMPPHKTKAKSNTKALQSKKAYPKHKTVDDKQGELDESRREYRKGHSY